MKDVFPEIDKHISEVDESLSLKKWINERFESHNCEAFYGRSFIKLEKIKDNIIKSLEVTT